MSWRFMMDYERLVAVGGHFDGKLMLATAVGLNQLRIPIHDLTAAEVIHGNASPTSEMQCEDYIRGEFTTQEKVFAAWIVKGMTYAEVMQRLLDRYRGAGVAPKNGPPRTMPGGPEFH